MSRPAIPDSWGPVLWRLPFLVLAAGVLALSLRLPYRTLNCDVAVFGIMGNDILKHGYWPTLAYGQSYLFSLTPYVYAALRELLPQAIAPAVFLKLAGTLLVLAGWGGLYEGLLTTQRSAGRPVWPALLGFCLFVACSSSYVFDMFEHSGLEVSICVLGAAVALAAQLEACLSQAGPPDRSLWFLFGLVAAFALYSRPQVFPYAVIMGVLLLVQALRRQGPRPCGVSAAWAAAGAGLGYLPMLLHHLVREPHWPYRFAPEVKMATGRDFAQALEVLRNIGRVMFDLSPKHNMLYTLLAGLWLLAALAAFLWAIAKHGSDVRVVDLGLVGGSLICLTVMLAVPAFAVNITSRRYCLQIFPVMSWLFVRYGMPGRRTAAFGLAAIGIFFLASLPIWANRLGFEFALNDEFAEQVPKVVPELMRYNATIFADDWDAYVLSFVSGGALRVESYPWHFVRTYGAFSEACMRQRTMFLVRGGYGDFTRKYLTTALGEAVMQRNVIHKITSDLRYTRYEFWEMGEPYSAQERKHLDPHYRQHVELWEVDPDAAIQLLKRDQPGYFSNVYPSRP